MTVAVAHVCLENTLTPEYKMWAAELDLPLDFVPFTLLHHWEEGGVFQDPNEEEALYDIVEEHYSHKFGYDEARNDNGRQFIGDLTDEIVTCCKRLYRLFGDQLDPLMRTRTITDLGTYERPEIDVKVCPSFIAMSIKEYEFDDAKAEREVSDWIERRDVQAGRVRDDRSAFPNRRGDATRSCLHALAEFQPGQPRRN